MALLVIRKLIGSIYIFGFFVFFTLAYYAWSNGFSLDLDDPSTLLPAWLLKVSLLVWFLSWLVHGCYMLFTGRSRAGFDLVGILTYVLVVGSIPGGIPHITPSFDWTALAGMYLVYFIPMTQFMDLVIQAVDWLAEPAVKPALRPEA